MADEFLKEEGNDTEDVRLRINLWKAKTLYLIGDYKESLDQVDEQVNNFLEKHPSLKKEFGNADNYSSLEMAENSMKENKQDAIEAEGCTVTEIKDEDTIQIQKSEVSDAITYIFLKYRLL